MGSFGRRRRHLRGFGDFDGFGSDIGQGVLALGVGAAGYFTQRFVSNWLAPSLGQAAKVPTMLAALVGGALLSKRSPAAGYGLVGGAAGVPLVETIESLIIPAPVSGVGAYPWTRRYGVHGVGAYPWSRRYGMHAVGQMDPYAVRMPLLGLGRTRVIEQEPRAYEVNGLGAGYSYHSSAVRLSGLGQPKPTYYGWGLGRRATG